jgi:hypothetical protein
MDWVAAKGSWKAIRGRECQFHGACATSCAVAAAAETVASPVLRSGWRRRPAGTILLARSRRAGKFHHRPHKLPRGAHLLPPVGDQHRDRDHSRDDRQSGGGPSQDAAPLHIAPRQAHWPHRIIGHGRRLTHGNRAVRGCWFVTGGILVSTRRFTFFQLRCLLAATGSSAPPPAGVPGAWGAIPGQAGAELRVVRGCGGACAGSRAGVPLSGA